VPDEPDRQPGLPPGVPRAAHLLAQRRVRAVHLRLPADDPAADQFGHHQRRIRRSRRVRQLPADRDHLRRFDPTFSGLPDWLSRLVATFPVKALAEVLQNTYAVRPFPAWDLANLGLWTAAGAVFAVWRFRWHS